MTHTHTLKYSLILVLSFLLLSSTTFGQYIETFSTGEKGILLGPCPGGTSASCALTDFVGVNWDINGNFTGFDAGFGTEDYLKTIAGILEFGGDIDEELCWESPILDISTVAGAASFSIAIVWNGHDAADYVDVEYQLDGGTWMQIPNVFGGGTHTIDFITSANSGSGTISQTGLSGSILSIRVCVDTNTLAENTTIDDVSVPEVGAMILPVELISFSAQKNEHEVLIEWITALEINNEKFEIQHSTDGQQFHKISELQGNGTTEAISNYSYSHGQPSMGENYYRLKQIDFNGQFEYSKIASVSFETNQDHIGSFYPNPNNTGNVFLDYFSSKKSDTEISIYDISGKYISKRNVELVKGENNLNIDVKNLIKGIYFINISNDLNSFRRKLVVD